MRRRRVRKLQDSVKFLLSQPEKRKRMSMLTTQINTKNRINMKNRRKKKSNHKSMSVQKMIK